MFLSDLIFLVQHHESVTQLTVSTWQAFSAGLADRMMVWWQDLFRGSLSVYEETHCFGRLGRPKVILTFHSSALLVNV